MKVKDCKIPNRKNPIVISKSLADDPNGYGTDLRGYKIKRNTFHTCVSYDETKGVVLDIRDVTQKQAIEFTDNTIEGYNSLVNGYTWGLTFKDNYIKGDVDYAFNLLVLPVELGTIHNMGEITDNTFICNPRGTSYGTKNWIVGVLESTVIKDNTFWSTKEEAINVSSMRKTFIKDNYFFDPCFNDNTKNAIHVIGDITNSVIKDNDIQGAGYKHGIFIGGSANSSHIKEQ